MGEGSGRSPPRPRARPGRPSLGRVDGTRLRPCTVRAASGPRAPGAAAGARAGCSRNPSPALPPARRRASRRSPRGPPRPRGPVPYQLGGEPGRPSGIEKSRHWEVLGEGGAGLKGTTTSFHWGSRGNRGATEAGAEWEERWAAAFVLAPRSRSPSVPLSTLTRKKKVPQLLGVDVAVFPICWVFWRKM